MKKFTFVLLLLSIFVITSCSIVPDLGVDTIQIRLENISNKTLENLSLEDIKYGTLTSGEVSDYQSFEYFQVQGDYIMSQCNATIDNQEVMNGCIMFCGMGLESLEPGKYTIEVDYEYSEKGYSGLSLRLK